MGISFMFRLFHSGHSCVIDVVPTFCKTQWTKFLCHWRQPIYFRMSAIIFLGILHDIKPTFFCMLWTAISTYASDKGVCVSLTSPIPFRVNFTGDIQLLICQPMQNSVNGIPIDLTFTLFVLQPCHFSMFFFYPYYFEKEASASHGPKRYPYGFIVQKMALLTWVQHMNLIQTLILIRYNISLFIAVVTVIIYRLWYFMTFQFLWFQEFMSCFT